MRCDAVLCATLLTVCLSQLWRADGTFSLPIADVSFQEPRLYSAHNFAVVGPILWNSLPANIRYASVSLQTFAGRLKTYLFELL